MLSGAHVMIFSHDAEADRTFFRDVLRLPAVDAGGGWLIFALPPAESSFHGAPADAPNGAELFLMCEDIAATVARLRDAGVACDPTTDQGWGLATRIAMPSGARLGLYQPRHAQPPRG